MTSPLSLLVNAEITVYLPSDSVIINPDTGNYEVASEPQLIQAYLKAASPSLQYQAGIDPTEILLNGYCVDPIVLPPTVVLPAKCPCRIKTTSANWLTGEIELKPIPSKAALVDALIGQKIEGIFRSNAPG